jgi:hypothetical protein
MNVTQAYDLKPTKHKTDLDNGRAAMKITTGELMALNAVVSETADLYNLPTSAAGHSGNKRHKRV